MTAPYIPFYVGDYLADTTHLTRSEHGAYLLLLMAMWRGGGRLPADDDRLARLAQCSDAEWAGMRSTILSFFRCRGGVLRQKRLTAEYAKYTKAITQRKNAGKASAAKKRSKNSEIPSTGVGTGEERALANPSHSHNPIQKQNYLNTAETTADWPTSKDEWVDVLISETGCADSVRDIWPRTTAPVLLAWHEIDHFEWRDVVAGIRATLLNARKPIAPKSWKFFAPAIAEARRQRTQPTPEPCHAPNTKAAYRSRAERSRAERNEDSTIAAFSRAFGGPAAGEAEFEGSA